MNQIEQLLKKYRFEREKLDYLIETLEKELGVESKPKHSRAPRPEGATAIPALGVKVLEQAGPAGLTIPVLVAEITKLGYQSSTENPANSVNSTLHKAAKKKGVPIVRFGNKWYLTKYAPAQAVMANDEDVQAAMSRVVGAAGSFRASSPILHRPKVAS